MSEKKISSKFIYFFGAFGGILFGYDIGVMTGALPFLQSDWNLSGGGVTGWITSSLMLGAVFGGAIAGQLSDRLGRRKMVLYSALLFMVGALLAGVSPHDGVAYLIFTRVLLGVAVGAASALVPAYMSEMAPAEKRGSLSGINQLMIVSGMLISYVVDFLLKGLPEHIAWRLMLALAAVPALILFLGVLRLPESPRFLIKAGRVEEAHKVLTWIRRPEEIDGEINAINETARIEQKAEKSTSWGSLLEGRYRYLVIAGVMVEKASGQAASDALLWPIIQGVILVLGALLYMAIAEKFNRRGLLMMGGTVMGLSFILPAVINSFMDTNPMMIVVFLSIFVAFYAFTWAPLTWVLVGEVFPLAIRGRASGLASSMNWVGSFVVALIFPIMTASMSQEAVFAIFGVICLVAVAFVMFRVPETRGHSLEEIEKLGAEKEAK